MNLLFLHLFSATGSDYVWQEGVFTPLTYLLAFQNGILLIKQLKLFFHCFNIASLSFSVIFGIEFACLSCLFCVFWVWLAGDVLLFQKLVKVDEVVL
jgi:hypothetical protein